MKVEDKIYYHICVYPKFDLCFGIEYNTSSISRVYENREDNTIELAKMSREVQLEKYRSINCPETPSRTRCFYVCTESQVELWLKILIKRKNIWYKIYQVSVTGEIFFANANDIEITEAYWKGCEENDEQCTVEGLLVGSFNVINDCTINFARP